MTDQPRLAPRSLGITAPEGSDVYELYMKVKSRPSVLGSVSSLVGSKGIDILWMAGQASDDKQTADFFFFAEMGSSTASPSEVVEELRKQDFVLEARSRRLDRVYFETFAFPLTSGGHRRVMVLDGRGWAALVKSLHRRFGSAATAILHDQGVSFGAELVERMSGRFRPGPDAELLVDNIKALFKASGLGILEIGAKRGKLSASIADHVVSLGGDESLADDFLVGVVRGALEGAYGRELRVDNLSHVDGTMTFDLVGA
ncbi:MAG: hypothetical protein JRM82_03305 [Nitrososphaerota archaeon]|nr:hypothetical protein [Nitrososphaerota archaeon]MDG7016383.1 hypothetical protein [Nitrososphaerota archaeon]